MSDLVPIDPFEPRRFPGRLPDPAPADAGSYVTGASFRGFLALMRRNAGLVVLGTVATAAPVAYLTLRQPPAYRAHALIRLVDGGGAMTRGLGSAVADQVVGGNTDAIRSQLMVLKGREVLGRVVDREGLRLVAEGIPRGDLVGVRVAPEAARDTVSLRFTAAGVEARGRRSSARAAYGAPLELGGVAFAVRAAPEAEAATVVVIPREVATDLLAGRLTAAPQERTDAVEIAYTADDPRVAQRVVNSVVDVFQRSNEEEAQRESRRRRIFLEEQTRHTGAQLVGAQAQLTAYRTRQQLFSSREKVTAQQQGLLALDSEREQLNAERRMHASLLSDAQRQGAATRSGALRTLVSSPAMAANPVVSTLFTQLAEYETQREALTAGPSGNTAGHPDVVRLDGLIASTQGKLLDAARSNGAALDARIGALDGLRARSAGGMQQMPGMEAEEERLRQQAQSVQRMSDRLQEELQVARMTEAVKGGEVSVVYRAPLPQEPVDSGRGWKMGLGLMVGLLVGTGGALAREATNTSIRGRSELGSILSIPDLGTIPHLAPPRGAWVPGTARLRRTGSSLALQGADGPSSEAYRMLRTRLLFSERREALRTVMVTSAAPGEGKTTTAANLAIAFAQQGYRVLLMDCDLRRPRLHPLFSLARGPGLAHILRGDVMASAPVQETATPRLSVITSGDDVPNPSELLGSAAMRDLLGALRTRFDLVILDTPPVLAASDAASLASRVDGVVLVVSAGRTKRDDARQAGTQLVAVGAHMLGAVLNDPDGNLQAQDGYAYYGYRASVGA